MSKVSRAPARDFDARALRDELDMVRREMALLLMQVRENNARREEMQWTGWTVARLAERWGVTKETARGIIRSTGIKGRKFGVQRTVWDVRDLPRLDAAWRDAGEEVGA